MNGWSWTNGCQWQLWIHEPAKSTGLGTQRESDSIWMILDWVWFSDICYNQTMAIHHPVSTPNKWSGFIGESSSKPTFFGVPCEFWWVCWGLSNRWCYHVHFTPGVHHGVALLSRLLGNGIRNICSWKAAEVLDSRFLKMDIGWYRWYLP